MLPKGSKNKVISKINPRIINIAYVYFFNFGITYSIPTAVLKKQAQGIHITLKVEIIPLELSKFLLVASIVKKSQNFPNQVNPKEHSPNPKYVNNLALVL